MPPTPNPQCTPPPITFSTMRMTPGMSESWSWCRLALVCRKTLSFSKTTWWEAPVERQGVNSRQIRAEGTPPSPGPKAWSLPLKAHCPDPRCPPCPSLGMPSNPGPAPQGP